MRLIEAHPNCTDIAILENGAVGAYATVASVPTYFLYKDLQHKIGMQPHLLSLQRTLAERQIEPERRYITASIVSFNQGFGHKMLDYIDTHFSRNEPTLNLVKDYSPGLWTSR